MAGRSIVHAGPDFTHRLKALSTSIEKGRRDTLVAAGVAGKRAHAAVIQRDSGGDSRLSGVGKRGAKVGVRFDIRGERLTMKATGPLHFVANPMSPHRIPRVRKTNRAKRRVVVIPGVGVRAHARHPGTKGKNTWRRGVTSARPKVTKVMRSETANIIKRGFG